MIRRNDLKQAGKFNSEFYGLEDYDLWLRLALRCRFQYIHEVVGNYRYHTNRMTVTKIQEMRLAEIKVRQNVFDTPAFQALSASVRSGAFTVQAAQYFILGDSAAARSWFLRAIRTAPASPRPYLLFGLSLLGRHSFEFVRRLRTKLRGSTVITRV
jgi:hypothetical protein